MASLIIANQMGIAGSSAVMSWSKSARKWGQGVVKRGAMIPVRRGAIAAKSYAGEKAEDFQKSKHSFARTLRKVPGVAYGVGKVGAAGRATIKAAEEKHKNLSKEALEESYNAKFVSPTDKAAIGSSLIKSYKGDPDKQADVLRDLPIAKRKEVYDGMSPRDRVALEVNLPTSMAKALRDGLSQDEKDKTIKSEKETYGRQDEKDIKSIIGNPTAVQKKVRDISNAKRLKGLSNEILRREEIFGHFTVADFEELTDEGKLTKEDRAFIKSRMSGHPFFSTPRGIGLW